MALNLNPTYANNSNYSILQGAINAERVYTTTSTIAIPVSTPGVITTDPNYFSGPTNVKVMSLSDCLQTCTNDPQCQAVTPTKVGEMVGCWFNSNLGKGALLNNSQNITYVKIQNTCSGANQVYDSKSKSCVSCRDPTVKPSVVNSPSASSYTCINSSIKTFDKNNSLVSSTCDSGEVFNTLTNTCSITYNY